MADLALSEDALVLLHLASLDGDRVDPQRIAARPPERPSSRAFEELKLAGCLDANGWVTALGREALGEVQPDGREG